MVTSTPQLTNSINWLLKQYALGEILTIRFIPTGLIHETYKVEAETGCFAFQKLHPKLDRDEMLADYHAVTEYLADQGFSAPRLLVTREGKPIATDSEERRWRMSTWLDGINFLKVDEPSLVFQAARLLGKFHELMSNCEHFFLSRHPLHNTAHHLDALIRATGQHNLSGCGSENSLFIEEVIASLGSIEIPPLPRRVVHGDPKISNFLFNEARVATAIIDLDTCTRHTLLVDLGDAIRSWCRDGEEDEETPLCLKRFEALVQGYAASGVNLSASEIAFVPRAGRLITLELTARFLTDFLEDSYFSWDPARYPSRKAHNLARAKAMHFLAMDMREKENDLQGLVKQVFSS